MVSKEDLDWLKQRIFNTHIEGAIAEDFELEGNEGAKQCMRKAYKELEYSDFIVANTYKLLLEDEELAAFINAMKNIEKAEQAMIDCVGEDKYIQLCDLTRIKRNQWFELNSTDLAAKALEFYFVEMEKVNE